MWYKFAIFVQRILSPLKVNFHGHIAFRSRISVRRISVLYNINALNQDLSIGKTHLLNKCKRYVMRVCSVLFLIQYFLWWCNVYYIIIFSGFCHWSKTLCVPLQGSKNTGSENQLALETYTPPTHPTPTPPKKFNMGVLKINITSGHMGKSNIYEILHLKYVLLIYPWFLTF